MKTCPSKSSSQLFEKSMMRRVGGNVLVLSAAFASLSIEHSAHNTPISPAASATCNCGGLVIISHLFYDIKMSVFDRLNLFSLRCVIYLHVFTRARSCLCLRAHVRICAHVCVCAHTFVFARTRSCLCLRAHDRVCLYKIFASNLYFVYK